MSLSYSLPRIAYLALHKISINTYNYLKVLHNNIVVIKTCIYVKLSGQCMTSTTTLLT